jgi:hypothetical protein
MVAVVGTLLLALATLLLGWAMIEYRRPNPGRWTQAETPALAILFTTMGLLIFGVGELARFLIPLGEVRLGAVEAALIAAIVAAAWAGVLALRARWRRLTATGRTVAEDQSKVAVFPLGSSGEGSDPGKRPPRPLGGGRRAGRRKAA